jgi:hypothetical protein
MPYFVYKVFPFHRLERAAQFDAYRDASAAAKALRAEPGLAVDCKVRVMFAEDALTAELLLTEVHEPRPHIAEDD